MTGILDPEERDYDKSGMSEERAQISSSSVVDEEIGRRNSSHEKGLLP